MLKMYRETEIQQKKQPRRGSRFCARGNRVHFISLGCPRNLVDTEVMLGILLKAGYQISDDMTESDYIIINTCGFLEAARAEALEVIEEAMEERKKGARVIVTGCMVQTHSDLIKEYHPGVDYFLGSGDVESILNAVEAEGQGTCITSSRSYLEAGEIPRQISTPGNYAYLKIAEGCRKRCAYCIIPDIKGPLKSKPLERVVKEFQLLLDQGIKEVILIAQDLGDWGKDKGFRKSDGLVKVLEELLKDKRDFWLRLLYVYPDEITDELIDLIHSDSRICRYLDMPIQHINDDILKSMRRKTSREDILNVIAKLRGRLPELTIRTSLIVGYPGETEEQFQQLLGFIEKTPLDNVGIFTFSPEEGSHAAALPDQISNEIKESRYELLAGRQLELLEQRQQKYIGQVLRVVVEGYHPESQLLMRGRHQGQCPEVDGQVIINDGRLVTAFGEFYDVEITDVMGVDLLGRVINQCL